jgi:hypothetical protein
MPAKAFVGVYIPVTLSFYLGFFPFPPAIRHILMWIGAYWLGIFMYLLIFFLLADFILLVGLVIKKIPRPVPVKARFYKGLAVMALTAVVVGGGIVNASRIKVVSYEIPLNVAALNGFTIVFISDLHLGGVRNEANLPRAVRAINSLNPDIVCLVGDIFNDDFTLIRNPEKAGALLKSIDAPYGVYAALGNHDGGPTLPQMAAFLRDSGITLLKDEYIIIDNRLALFGWLDAYPIAGFGGLERRDISHTMATVSESFPVIVMDHNPLNIGEYGAETSLVLSGHTHGGQMFPIGWITRALFGVDYGYYQRDANGPHVVITSGVGTWMPPMRIGTDNEVVRVVLK